MYWAVPLPCTFENIVSSIDITVSNVPTERTDMGSHRKRFLHNLATPVTLLRGETRVDSDDLMTSSLSLVFKNIEKCAPRSVHDGFRQAMILHHVEKTQLLNRNHLVLLGIRASRLRVKVSALSFDFQMGLCRAMGSLAPNTSHLRTKGGKRRQESSNLAYCQKGKRKTQGAFDVQITRNGR